MSKTYVQFYRAADDTFFEMEWADHGEQQPPEGYLPTGLGTVREVPWTSVPKHPFFDCKPEEYLP